MNDPCPQRRKSDAENCATVEKIEDWRVSHDRKHEHLEEAIRRDYFQLSQVIDKLRLDINTRMVNISDTSTVHRVKIENLENRISDVIAALSENSKKMSDHTVQIASMGIKVGLFGLFGSAIGTGVVIPLTLSIFRKLFP